ncbi:MAG TPA: winged helix-turn-helix domain-containing protein, partial [Methylotenera sp.]|nr:winged helix-turn-helix domain-containing protein [Methylotenera sp.]
MKLYEQLADSIAQSIQEGVLCRGDRLPSVRHASASRHISPSTVLEAYYLLEARGLITARERSGYFVTG